MNIGLILIALIAILAMTMHAQESEEKKIVVKPRFEKVKKNIVVGMRSSNYGLMEASFMLAAKMKMEYPQEPIVELKSILDSISIADASEGIRFKAYLSSYICGDPEWFAVDSSIAVADAEHFFPRAAQRLQQKMFGLNTP